MQSAIQLLYLKIHAPNSAYVLKYVKFFWTKRYLKTPYNAAEIIFDQTLLNEEKKNNSWLLGSSREIYSTGTIHLLTYQISCLNA